MGWVRRIAKQQRKCSNCWGVIDTEEPYFLTTAGERFCVECPPEAEHGEEVTA